MMASMDLNELFPVWLRLEPGSDAADRYVEGYFRQSDSNAVTWTLDGVDRKEFGKDQLTQGRQQRCVVVKATALQLAAHLGNDDIIQCLVEHVTCKLNVVNEDRQTVLHVTVRHPAKAEAEPPRLARTMSQSITFGSDGASLSETIDPVVQLLIERGIDTEIIDDQNQKVMC